ncbi:MAG: SUMF1/EgtB/PvdO family nonheme iron enzyme [Candidatus Aminicenantes bacterium]|nr:SUMF1/EgtB/PvdO family nonheme iron enzyme [Candidatus Aminicenantes bacterium]
MKEDDALKSVLQKLGAKYEYIRFIGQGSFSKVYLLHHKILGQEHALKIMDSHYILQTLEKGDARNILEKFEFIKKRFINEAKSYSKIHHPGVVQVYDVDVLADENEGLNVTYIIMQFVEGRSLKNILHETSPLEMDRVMNISKDILHAIARIHEAGIVHRDIKPPNIIIEKESDRAILIDFGLAKDIIDISESAAEAEIDKSMGTPIYMSPDQFQIHSNIGPGVDLYAFGILLYEMLTGDVPFKGTFAEIVKGHLLTPVPDVRIKNPLAPSGIQDIIKKALAKEPENRYHKAEDLLGDLEKIEKGLAVEKARNDKEKKDNQDSKETGEQKGKKRKYTKYLFMALTILISALVIYIFILSPRGTTEPGYMEYFTNAERYYKAGDLGKAAYNISTALKIKDTPEARDLAILIEAKTWQPEVGKDFKELEAMLNRDVAVDTKIAECRKFLDKYGNIPQNEDTKSIISQVQRDIYQLEAGITQQVDKYIADAEEYLKKGELKSANDSVKMAKKLGETVKTAELENKIFTASVSAAEAYCKEAKSQEAEENYLLAIEIKPDSNLQDLDKTIQFLKSMPGDVITIYKVNKQVKQNQQKAWEAEFGDGIVMVYIPASEGLTGYWMAKTEVSVTQYLKFVNETQTNEPEWQEKGSPFNVETGNDNYYRNQTGEDFPIVGISWNNANAYCQWLSSKTGMNFKLPSESQWQKAAQGTDGRKYPWGNNFPEDNLANFSSLSTKTIKVDANPRGASPYGLLNMAGNAEEWCDNQSARGGSFYDNERFITCSSRRKYEPAERNNALGFRVCMVNKE